MDAGSLYSVGICGEKLIALDVPSPPYLTLIPNSSDPVTLNFQVMYSKSSATEADIGAHTVSYTVTFKEYTHLASSLETFEFEILCPSTVDPADTTLDVAMGANSFYDLASGVTLSLATPVVSVNPVACFSVTSFIVLDNGTLTAPSYLSTSVSSVDIITDERSLLGSHTLLIQAVISNGETLHPHTFDLTFQDSCRRARLVESVELEKIEIRAMESEILKKSYASFTDTISDGYGLINTCGAFAYSLLDPAPSFASVTHTDGDGTFAIEIDVS